jgi:hypothetical protein
MFRVSWVIDIYVGALCQLPMVLHPVPNPQVAERQVTDFWKKIHFTDSYNVDNIEVGNLTVGNLQAWDRSESPVVSADSRPMTVYIYLWYM